MVGCVGCARHVRVTEARCPFCGAAVEAGEAPSRELPRGASRAMIAALGVSLSLGACQGRTSTATRTPADGPRTPPAEPHVEAHPTIVAPYGAPPDPTWAERPPAVRWLRWLVTVTGTIPLAARATIPLEISATNQGPETVRPERGRLRMLVNGVPSPVFDLAFNNGAMAPEWEALPVDRTVRDSRMLLEALLPSPGEYLLVLEWDGQRVAGRSVTVTP